MARYDVRATVEDSRIDAVKKRLAEIFPAGTVSVTKIETNPSRTERLSVAESLVEDAKSIVQELYDEMENWYDGMPENLQGSSKGEEVEACRDALDELNSNLDQADFGSIEFPGMY